MSTQDTSSADFFEAKYQADAHADPWNFASASYELGRYDAVMHALSGRRYAHAFEPGCSVGVLTEQVATLCDHVDACDFSPTAARVADDRCAALANVRVRCAALTANEPWQDFDLVVLSEIGYYFTAAAWQDLVERMVLNVRPATVVLACHWLGHSVDHVQDGRAVHAALQHPRLQRTLSEHQEHYILERWTRLP